MKYQNGLFTVSQYSEYRAFRTKLPLRRLLSVAKHSDLPFVKLCQLGTPISDPKYAELEQSNWCSYSVEFDLDYRKAKVYIPHEDIFIWLKL